jgi:hypothetical protein
MNKKTYCCEWAEQNKYAPKQKIYKCPSDTELKLEELYSQIPEGTGLLDTVREIVELELLLEAESNK